MSLTKYRQLLHQAANMPELGISVASDNPEKLRKLLAELVRELADPKINKLTFFLSPMRKNHLLIIRGELRATTEPISLIEE